MMVKRFEEKQRVMARGQNLANYGTVTAVKMNGYLIKWDDDHEEVFVSHADVLSKRVEAVE
jgi:hypothetical protein